MDRISRFYTISECPFPPIFRCICQRQSIPSLLCRFYCEVRLFLFCRHPVANIIMQTPIVKSSTAKKKKSCAHTHTTTHIHTTYTHTHSFSLLSLFQPEGWRVGVRACFIERWKKTGPGIQPLDHAHVFIFGLIITTHHTSSHRTIIFSVLRDTSPFVRCFLCLFRPLAFWSTTFSLCPGFLPLLQLLIEYKEGQDVIIVLFLPSFLLSLPPRVNFM